MSLAYSLLRTNHSGVHLPGIRLRLIVLAQSMILMHPRAKEISCVVHGGISSQSKGGLSRTKALPSRLIKYKIIWRQLSFRIRTRGMITFKGHLRHHQQGSEHLLRDPRMLLQVVSKILQKWRANNKKLLPFLHLLIANQGLQWIGRLPWWTKRAGFPNWESKSSVIDLIHWSNLYLPFLNQTKTKRCMFHPSTGLELPLRTINLYLSNPKTS